MKELWCIYCHEAFIAKNGQSRWHNCPKAVAEKNKIKREWIKDWRKRNPEYKPHSEYEEFKRITKNLKRCTVVGCNNLTANYFGRCDSCLSKIENTYNLEFGLYI